MLFGRRKSKRIVIRSETDTADVNLVKFIAGRDVLQGDYPLPTGLGLRSNAELIGLLETFKED